MQEQPSKCQVCGAEKPGLLARCDVCETWVCPECGGVRFDEEAQGVVCWECFQMIHSPKWSPAGYRVI